MKQLVSFCKGLDSLNNEEFQTCMNSFGKADITTILFHGFHQQFNHNKMDKIKKINKIIAEIQISRQEKKTDDITQQNEDDDDDDEDIDIELNAQNTRINIDELPSVLLVEISSYLTLTENISFERSNRSIFIGSRTSTISTSQSLAGNEFIKLLEFYNENTNNIQNPHNLTKFKSLTINGNEMTYYDEEKEQEFLKYKWNHLEIFKHIQQLNIEFIQCPWGDELELISKQINSGKHNFLQNLKIIRVIKHSMNDGYTLDGEYDHETMAKFLSFIKNAANLDFFELSMNFHYPYSIFSDHHPWISKLRGIAINNIFEDGNEDDSLEDIYSVIGNKLESFHKTSSLFTDAINGKLSGLKEICLPWNSDESDINILNQQNLSKIQRISFNNVAVEYIEEQTTYNKHTMQVLMDKIISSAEYIAIDMTSKNTQSLDIFDILIGSLECMKKEVLKFRINAMSLEETDVFNINAVINILSKHCSNFMFIANNLQFSTNNSSLDNLLELMKQKHAVICSKNPIKENDKCLQYNFVITNKKCNISGYHEPWIMQCAYCQQDVLFD